MIVPAARSFSSSATAARPEATPAIATRCGFCCPTESWCTGWRLEGSAIPGYGQLQKLHVPLTGSRLGYSDILPKYASATGGEIFSGFSRDAIETTYAGALGEARNQYTLGYVTHATPSNTHREIEVRVSRPDLKISAKEGYYPVGLAR